MKLDTREGGYSEKEKPNRQAERLPARLGAVSARPGVFGSSKKQELRFDDRHCLRLDSLPPSDDSKNASKKLELPPTKKDDLKAPGKKSGTSVKKEKPKQMPPKVKGAEPWRDCPVEFLKYAKEGMVSARVSIPGPGFVLKEAGAQNRLFITEAPGFSDTIDSAPKNSSNTRSKSNRTSPKPKGKSK